MNSTGRKEKKIDKTWKLEMSRACSQKTLKWAGDFWQFRNNKPLILQTIAHLVTTGNKVISPSNHHNINV